MSIDSLRVLSSESVQHLKGSVLKKPELVELSFPDLVSELRLVLVPSPYRFDDGISLLMPEGSAQSTNGDTKNCRLILSALPGLTPAFATDDRLWVTLCFSAYKSYCLSRWPINARGEEHAPANIRNHFFANGVRGRMRDNAIARLWWMGHIASRIEDMDPDTVFEILFANSDYRSSLLERNSSSNATSVVSAVLKITREQEAAGIHYQRAKFRSFMSRVDLLGGRCNLAALTADELMERLRPLYVASYRDA